jgi:hypothetical protein
MTATSPPLVPARRGLRAVVARHPVPAMLVMMFAVSWAILIPPALAGIDLVPVFLLIAVLFGQLLQPCSSRRPSAAGPPSVNCSAASSAGACRCRPGRRRPHGSGRGRADDHQRVRRRARRPLDRRPAPVLLWPRHRRVLTDKGGPDASALLLSAGRLTLADLSLDAPDTVQLAGTPLVVSTLASPPTCRRSSKNAINLASPELRASMSRERACA